MQEENDYCYRVLVEELTQIGNERPELLYAVQELRRHLNDAKQNDLTAAKRLMLYLFRTSEKTLRLEVDDSVATPETLRPLEVHVTSGRSWTSTTDRHSVNGGALWIEGFLLRAWSETQSKARSEHEADLRAANLCAEEGLFVMSILEEIGLYPSYTCSRTTAVRTETIDATTRTTFLREQCAEAQERRTIPKKQFWLSELAREQRPEVLSMPNQLNVADVFVRALPQERFEWCMNVLGIRDPVVHADETVDPVQCVDEKGHMCK